MIGTMKRIILAALVGVLSGCTLQHAADANRAQKEMVGLTRTELFQCAGVPHRTANEGGLDYLVYSAEQTTPYKGGSFSENCDATFILRNDVVIKVMYRGDTGGLHPIFKTKGRACFPIIEHCLKK